MAADDRAPGVEWTDAEREEVRDELAHTTIGTGYYSTTVGIDEATEMTDAVLDALAPFVAERERQAAARALQEAEVERLRATVARVEALAEEWQRLGLPGMTEFDYGTDLRAALEGDR